MASLPPVVITDDMSYEQRLYQHTINTGTGEPHFMMFRGLQRLNIMHLQNELAQMKKATWEAKQSTREKNDVLTRLLHDYTNTIRDYEYLSKLVPVTGSQAVKQRLDIEQAFEEVGNLPDDAGAYRRFADASLLPSDPLRDALKRALPKSLTYTKREMGRRTNEYLMGQPPEEVSPLVDKLARFLVAFAGGAALVVPMLIMRLPEVTLVKSLVTVSVAVLLFSGALSIGLRASNTDTMVSTATYAAVLVVFVGTTS